MPSHIKNPKSLHIADVRLNIRIFELAQFKIDIAISQRKYALDLLEETCILDCADLSKVLGIQMLKLFLDMQRQPEGSNKYGRLVGKLNYLTIVQSNILFVVSVVYQFFKFQLCGHCYAVIHLR